jgi:GcrA cell cycle regulator
MSYDWTVENVETLERLWLIDGMSASLIAEQMQGGLTRCSVIGKVHRLKLTRGYSEQPSIRKPAGNGWTKERGPYRRSDRPRRVATPQPPKLPRVKVAPVAPIVLEPPSLDLTILQINSQTCKWVHGDSPNWNFCGHPVQPDKPYCVHHAERCLIPPPPKRISHNSYVHIGKFGRVG